VAQSGRTLVYGGTDEGLMKTVSSSAHAAGGRVVGVIPEFLIGRAGQVCDELVVVKDLKSRKSRMEELSDAFIALPGGIGTLDETFDVLALKQLHAHDKPIVLVNVGGYYNPLVAMLEGFAAKGFVRRGCLALYHVADGPKSAMDYLDRAPAQRPST
jgi:uncharacterized protein (TIGR00730 family)